MLHSRVKLTFSKIDQVYTRVKWPFLKKTFVTLELNALLKIRPRIHKS